ncbi:hypothetical protein E3N88_41184 [Mikania micrantha]|uniref:Uncharacterized protein n=1 Tax=Mikania micrantha TaxID=192012 RepID=A0A5N6LPU2_9ASTR|nr:hypothetical protein E3N88_41184 [Mikania micrantha]
MKSMDQTNCKENPVVKSKIHATKSMIHRHYNKINLEEWELSDVAKWDATVVNDTHRQDKWELNADAEVGCDDRRGMRGRSEMECRCRFAIGGGSRCA